VYVLTSKCAGVVGCSCYIFELNRSINSKWQFLVVPLLNSVSELFHVCNPDEKFGVYMINLCVRIAMY
jgi:hypothetical protein